MPRILGITLASVAVLLAGSLAHGGFTPPANLEDISGGLHYTPDPDPPTTTDTDGLSVAPTDEGWGLADVFVAWNIIWDSDFSHSGAWRYTYTYQNTANNPIISDFVFQVTPEEFLGVDTRSMTNITVFGSEDGSSWTEIPRDPEEGDMGFNIEFDEQNGEWKITFLSDPDLLRNLAWGFYSLNTPVWGDWTSKGGSNPENNAENVDFGTGLDFDTPVFSFDNTTDQFDVDFLEWDGTEFTDVTNTVLTSFDEQNSAGNFQIVTLNGLVPEPSALVGLLSLAVVGGLGLGWRTRRRRR